MHKNLSRYNTTLINMNARTDDSSQSEHRFFPQNAFVDLPILADAVTSGGNLVPRPSESSSAEENKAAPAHARPWNAGADFVSDSEETEGHPVKNGKGAQPIRFVDAEQLAGEEAEKNEGVLPIFQLRTEISKLEAVGEDEAKKEDQRRRELMKMFRESQSQRKSGERSHKKHAAGKVQDTEGEDRKKRKKVGDDKVGPGISKDAEEESGGNTI